MFSQRFSWIPLVFLLVFGCGEDADGGGDEAPPDECPAMAPDMAASCSANGLRCVYAATIRAPVMGDSCEDVFVGNVEDDRSRWTRLGPEEGEACGTVGKVCTFQHYGDGCPTENTCSPEGTWSVMPLGEVDTDAGGCRLFEMDEME